MHRERKLVMLEINEVPPRVIDDYVHKRPRSALARLLGQSKRFETVCEDQIELDPWISWPTLHRGVIDQQHQIKHLGQSLEAANDRFPPLWDLLARAGKRVGVMGALHSSAVPAGIDKYAFYVPDVFANSVFAHPPELRSFQAFNLAMTRRSTRNVDTGVPRKQALQFLLSYARQGVSVSTIKKLLGVLVGERFQPHLKTRRRALQSLITLDLFLHWLEQTQPDFACMHSNHVAAAMHRYWAAAFPEDRLGSQMSREWHDKYRAEVEFAMDVFDAMVERLSAFCDAHPEYKLVLASSLGQAGIETVPTEGFYTIRDIAAFMLALGVPAGSWRERHAMAPCVAVVFDTQADADAFEAKLLSLSVGEHVMQATDREIPPLAFDRAGRSFQLYIYFEAYRGPRVATLAGKAEPFDKLGLSFHAHEDGVACSGRHTPDGILVVYDSQCRAARTSAAPISTLDIAPAVLDQLGVEVPNYMREPDATLLDAAVDGARSSATSSGGGVEQAVARREAS